MGQYRRCGLGGESLQAVPGQEREPDIGVGEAVTLDQTANSDRRAIAKASRVQAKAMPCVAVDRALQQVFAGVRQGPHTLVADESNERRFIQQLEDESS